MASSGSVPLEANEPSWIEQVSTEGRGAGCLGTPRQSTCASAPSLDPRHRPPRRRRTDKVSPSSICRYASSRAWTGNCWLSEPKRTAHPFRRTTSEPGGVCEPARRGCGAPGNLAEQQTRARALEESDRLKSALVSSVSHELKTPLAAIKASATALLADTGLSGSEAGVRRELAESIDRETGSDSRVWSPICWICRAWRRGRLRPKLEWVSIADVIAEVLDRLEPVLEGRQVTVDEAATLPTTPLDFVQMTQVITNLLDNASCAVRRLELRSRFRPKWCENNCA